MHFERTVTSSPEPVIALHCSGAGAGQWRQLGQVLGAGYDLRAPEHFGCKTSRPLGWRPRLYPRRRGGQDAWP